MSKQVKNKKGKVAKSALSVALAASMVVSSSAFVYASPVVEEVSPADVQLEAPAVIGEESVGIVEIQGINLNKTEFSSAEEVKVAFESATIERDDKGTSTVADCIGKNAANWDVTINGDKIKNLDAIPTSIGEYTLVISGKNNATGTASAKYSIIANLEDNAIANLETPIYNGKEQKPTIKSLMIGDAILTEGKDFEVLGYYNNINACDVGNGAYFEVQYINDYKARLNEKVYFSISAIDLTDADVKVVVDSVKYNGAIQEPIVKLQFRASASDSYVELVKDTDFKVPELKSQNVKDYQFDIQGINNYSGNVPATYSIQQQDFNTSTIDYDVAITPDEGDKTSGTYPANIVVKDSATGTVLTKDVDYELLYPDVTGKKYTKTPQAKKAGTYDVRIAAIGNNYKEGKIDTKYTVGYVADSLQKYLTDGTVAFDGVVGQEYKYNSEGTVPTYIQITDKNKKVAKYYSNGTTNVTPTLESKYFRVVFPNKADCKNVGTYEIQLIGEEGYPWAGQTATIQYKVVAKDAQDVTISNPTVHKTNTGDLTAVLEIKDGTDVLTNGVDYTYVINPNTTNGYNIDITLKGNYTGSITKTVSGLEEKLSLKSDVITAEVLGEYVYTGKMIQPAKENIVVKEINNGVETILREGIDYLISYGTNVNVGKGIITLVGNGFYGDSREVTFDIKAGETEKDNYILDTSKLEAVYKYTGKEINPVNDIKVKTKDGKDVAAKDYSIEFYRDGKVTNDLKSTGNITIEYTIKATGVKLTANYRIAKELTSEATIPSTFSDASYTGKAIEPSVKVTKTGTVIELTQGKDFVVSYLNNINAGTAYITIEGIGDYYGTYTRTFKITPVELKGEIVLENDKVTLVEGGAKPVITVKDDKGNVIAASDYTVSYKDNDKAGTATVIVTGNGNYKGTLEKTFTVVEGELSIPVFQETALKARNTNANTYVLDVKGAAGTLSYSSNKESIATVDAEGRISFKHKVGNATITVKDSATGKTLKVAVKVIPATPTIKVTAADNAFKVTASKVKDAGGYQIAYATKEDFSNQKKVAVKTTSKMTNKTVKAGNKVSYNVKVRAFKKVSGKYVFGKWSTVKVVKTK